MKLQRIIESLQKLHHKEIDLSLDRVKNLCKKLGNPQDQINCISVVGTNGKYSTIQALYSILKEAGYNCNIYTSPHILKINERFVFNNQILSDNELGDLLIEVNKINNGEKITFFEILTAAFFYHASRFPKNINIIESGLFHRFDATNILKKNLASVITSIGLDHLDWLPKEEQTDENFESEVLKAGKPVLVDFWAEWCGPCKQIGPTLEEISDEMANDIVIAKHNIDNEPNTPTKYGVRGIPTMLLFSGGELKATKVGATPKSDIVAWIKENI